MPIPSNPNTGVGANSPICSPIQECPYSENPELKVRIIEIRGLYKPGVDDRSVKSQGTGKNSGYVPGYISDDNKGRIFTNRNLDGTWYKDQQYIEITVQIEVIPYQCPLPSGAIIRWMVEDPDDPTNENPKMHPDAGRLIDPNDFSGDKKTGANPNDNDPRGKATAKPRFEQLDAKYALTGNETRVDHTTLRSAVRFHVSNVAGDNYLIRAEAIHPIVTLSTPAQTGVMTVWHRVEIEYVKMASAHEIPVDQISKYYDVACVQVDVSEKRVVSGRSDKVVMGADETLAYFACDDYCSAEKWKGGEFTHEGQGGWFFIVAANRFIPAKTTSILFEGDAVAQDDHIRLPSGTSFSKEPAVIRVYDSSKIAGISRPKPNNYDMHIKFVVKKSLGQDLLIIPHDYHQVNDPDNAFLKANLSHYGIASGTSIPIQVLSAGDSALIVAGISPGGKEVSGRHYFGGKLMVFTQVTPKADMIVTLCHELCHAFDNAHKCGNWDWEKKSKGTSCCMNYWFQFVLDDSSPRKPIPWTQNRQSANLCATHIISMRDYHLENNPGLNWK